LGQKEAKKIIQKGAPLFVLLNSKKNYYWFDKMIEDRQTELVARGCGTRNSEFCVEKYKPKINCDSYLNTTETNLYSTYATEIEHSGVHCIHLPSTRYCYGLLCEQRSHFGSINYGDS
jgi:hypothetical protein